MADIIANQTDIHAAIIFEDGEVTMVVPDVIPADPGQSVQWIIVPPNMAEVTFKIEDDPIKWDPQPSGQTRIKGTVRPEVEKGKEYKYSVSDGKGNVVDPRLQIRR